MFNLRRYLHICIIVVVSVLSAAAFAQEGAQTKITVGVIAQQNSDLSPATNIGTFYGINLDYLTNIARALELKVELKPYASIPNLLSDIAQGKIDGAVGFSKTPEREKHFLFSQPFFTSTIAVWYTDSSLTRSDPVSLRWVCVKGTAYCDRLENIGVHNLLRVDTRTQAFDAVMNGRANALISTYIAINHFLDDNDIVRGSVDIPSWLDEEEVRFIAPKSSQKLVADIDRILGWEREGRNIRSVASTNPYHINDKYLIEYRKALPNNDVITYSSSDDAFPFIYRNTQSGTLDGFLPDFIGLLQSRTGLKFKYIAPSLQLRSGLTAFQADIVPVAFVDAFHSSDWLITKPFMQNKFMSVRASNVETEHSKSSKSGILMSLKKQGLVHLSDWKHEGLVRYEDMKLLLSDLRSGKIDVAYMPQEVTHHLIANDGATGLLISEKETLTLSVAFAVSNHNTKLKNILDAVINTIDQNEINKINRAHRTFNLTLGYDQQQVYKYGAYILVFVLIALVGVYFFMSNMRLKIRLAEMNASSEEKEKQWLVGLINELNSIVFIHSEDNEIRMSNCERYNSGQCKGCSIYNRATEESLLGDEVLNHKIINGHTVKESIATQGCDLGIGNVRLERKTIFAPSSQKPLLMTVIQDITEQAEREEQLVCAQEKAQLAVKAREKFLATMSHELRTPISAVHGLLDLLQQRIVENSNKELLNQASNSLRHLNQLVDEILDYSKLEAGQLNVVSEQSNLVSVLSEAFRSFEAKALSKELSYKVAIKPFSQPLVNIDALRLTQVISNILSNAIKFTDEGEISVVAAVESNTLFLQVTDSGIGMSEAQSASVFNPFVQADDSVTRHYGGTGLGLSIVKRLVDCMQGSLSLESQPGVGTIVTVRLPVEPCEQQAEINLQLSYSQNLPADIRGWCSEWRMTEVADQADVQYRIEPMSQQKRVDISIQDETSRSYKLQEVRYPDVLLSALQSKSVTALELQSTVATPNWKKGKVLVAEDNLINQKLIAMQLQELGVNAEIVVNGHDALKYLSQNEAVNLILTDFHMPGMDGLELAAKVKSSPDFADIPVVAVSAEDSRLLDRRAKQSGVDALLYKPYGLEELKAMLELYISDTQQLSRPAWLSKYTEKDSEEIAAIFCSTMKEDIQLLSSTADENSKRKIVHRIKGASSAIGLGAIADEIIRAEKSDAIGFQLSVSRMVSSLEQEIENTEKWMKCI